MYRSLVVVDDFYPQPHEVRAAALACRYPEVEGPRTFAGRNADCRWLPPGLDPLVSDMVGEPVRSPTEPRFAHGAFRLTLRGDEGRYLVHVDPNVLSWVGVCYLSLPEHCQGGTTFFRHKGLASDRTPLTTDELVREGVPDIAALLRRDGRNPDKWETLMTVPMRFNRMILYRPWLWHSAAPGFGTTPETARLVQLFAFVRP